MTLQLQNDIIKEMERSFKKDSGYLISAGHFEIGKKLHAETYYFIKKFFQSKDNCDKMARLLLEKMQEKFKRYPRTTLIGFGNYSGLLLSLACEKDKHYNYAILENDGNSFAFQTEPDLADNIIIVLPVTCTCATYFRLKKYVEHFISENGLSSVVSKEFIITFLILEEKVADKLNDELQSIHTLTTQLTNEGPQIDKNTENLYTSYGWKQVSNEMIDFGKDQPSAYSLITLKSGLYLPEVCPHCFPELAGKQLDKEKHLFTTHNSYGTPNLIFDLHNFNYKQTPEHVFKDALGFDKSNRNPHLFGNIVINNNSYLDYIRGNIFYNNNSAAILEFFNKKLAETLKPGDEVLFISADTKHSSSFLENIIKTPSLNKRKVTILRYLPYHEFVDNFISMYRKVFNENTKVIYFEDILSGGQTFKLVSDYIKHSKIGQGRKTGFDFLLTLLDRTSNFKRDEILRKLSSGSNNDNDLIYFFKLNVPIISAAHLGDARQEKYSTLKRLAGECHLDALKVIFARDIQINSPKNLRELEVMEKEPNTRHYIPLKSIEPEVYLFYQKFFNQQKLNYVRLFLTHEINSKLSFQEYRNKSNNIIDRLVNDLKNPVDEILINSKSENDKYDSALRRPDFEKYIIKNIILSILSKPPFTYYEDIYNSVFSHSIGELKKYDRVDKNGDLNRMDANEFIQLKTLIKRSVELNSNYIISHEFLHNIMNDYLYVNINNYLQGYKKEYQRITERDGDFGKVLRTNIEYKYKQLISYNYFLLYCYKTLISRNPGRSIRLEELINSEELSPERIIKSVGDQRDYKSLKKLWYSPYYLFNRILKAENIYLLSELKELHKEQIIAYKDKKTQDKNRNIYNEDPDIINLRAYYFQQKKNDVIINNARELIKKSASYGSDNYRNIVDAVCYMLRVVNILHLERKNTVNETKTGKARNNESKLNNEVRTILDAVLKILSPGIEKDRLNYAFFIEYREPKGDTYNLYPIISKGGNDFDYDNFTVKLNEKGLIYKTLYGLTDTIDGTNPQTLLFAGKIPGDDAIHSFHSVYYKAPESSVNGTISTDYLKITDETYLDSKKLEFDTLFKNDYWNNETKTGLKMLEKSNMTLLFRLSNLVPIGKNEKNYRLKGQAVLVVTNTQETTISNFLNFMNIEKIRLLLLIKEDLLKYLQKQFDNDAFVEIIENRKKAIYQLKLEHGINRYLETQHRLFDQVIVNSNEEEIRKRRILYDIVKRAIQGQISFKYDIQNSDLVYKEYDSGYLLEIMSYIFECPEFGDAKIPFKEVNCSGFDSKPVIAMHAGVLEVVIPEVIQNMKKYSSRLIKNGLEITYSADDNHLIFKNDIRIAKRSITGDKEYGGLDMCREIMERLNYEEFKCSYTNDTYNTVINLNTIKNADKNINS